MDIEDDMLYFESPKYYIIRMKKETYVIIDLQGITSKDYLEKLLNSYVGSELLKSKRNKEICNPYNGLDAFIRDIEREYDVLILKNPTEIKINDNLMREISKYNKNIISNKWGTTSE